jgi:hypothetical protein
VDLVNVLDMFPTVGTVTEFLLADITVVGELIGMEEHVVLE